MSENSKMDELTHTPSLSEFNYSALITLFPNAVTEIIDEEGMVRRAINADVLAQEINSPVISGAEEPYLFTWPGKKNAVLMANTPAAAALRPCCEKSVQFDIMENLYIEGGSLDALKLLREPYFGKIKVIYVDTPYNKDSFHAGWLNLVYPRLRAARDLLREDGVIFINCNDNELYNLKKICDEIFGEINFISCFSSHLSQKSNRVAAFAFSMKYAGKKEESLKEIYPLLFCELEKDRIYLIGTKTDLETLGLDMDFKKLKLNGRP